MNNPLVSVVIPTYNHGVHIAQAVDSILNQSYYPVEIVVVDDGSTDNTQEVLEAYRDRIRYIRQANQGPSAARNTGINHAAGTFIALLDADDVWLPAKLEKQMEFFKQNPDLDLVYSDIYQSFNGRRHPLTYWQRNKIRPCRGSQNCLVPLFQTNFIPGGISTVFKKNLMDKIGFFNENLRMAEDYEYWLRAVAHGATIDYIDEPLAIYNMHHDQSTKDTERVTQDTYHVLRETILHNRAVFKDRQSVVKQRFSRLFASAAYHQIRSGNWVLAFKNGWRAIVHLSPFYNEL